MSQSVFRILEEELLMKSRNDQALLAKFDDRLGSHSHYHKSKFGGSDAIRFTVEHYARNVTYDVNGFLQKNMDHASDAVTQTINSMQVFESA